MHTCARTHTHVYTHTRVHTHTHIHTQQHIQTDNIWPIRINVVDTETPLNGAEQIVELACACSNVGASNNILEQEEEEEEG